MIQREMRFASTQNLLSWKRTIKAEWRLIAKTPFFLLQLLFLPAEGALLLKTLNI
tara:strand:+ start:239 stop:403 length:165 start_codon:yes stop_codon:yes gene_type:complete